MKQLRVEADRLAGFNQPTIWSIMTRLAIRTKSINLGQGSPTWDPPNFFKQHLQYAIDNSDYQYSRSFGSVQYVNAVAEFHRPAFGQIDPQNNVCIVNGGVEGLYSSVIGLINPGDEVIIFDPSYDCYRPHVQIAGGISIGIPLVPRKNQSKSQLKKRLQSQVTADQNDEWNIDFQAFEHALNHKTKIVILNSPHNPTGKVFTNQEIIKLASILKKFPQVCVLEDNVYESVTFDDMFNKPLPKMAFIQGMRDRTISVYSAGKLFSATGIRSGWIIGPTELIRAARTSHQYTFFCQNNLAEMTLARCLQDISKPGNTYVHDTARKLCKHRNLLVRALLQSPLDIDIWIPKGGYFILADISRVTIMEKYLTDENGNKRSKDYAFSIQLAFENGVVCIPMSPFYGYDNAHLGSKYVRFAFCKEEEMIFEAGRRLHK